MQLSICIFFLQSINTVHSLSETLTWAQQWTYSAATLPETLEARFIVYDPYWEWKDCIFSIGGPNCAQCMYCYNITSDTLYTWDESGFDDLTSFDLENDVFSNTVHYYNTTLAYFINKYISNIYQYDFSTKTLTTLYNMDAHNVDAACLVGRPPNSANKNELYIIPGDVDNRLYIYSINENVTYQGPNLTYSRVGQSCISTDYYKHLDGSNYQYDNKSIGYDYLYVIAGDTPYIERINLSNTYNDVLTNSWETLSVTLNNVQGFNYDFGGTVRHIFVAPFKNFIYLIGGQSSLSADYDISDITAFDLDSSTLHKIGDAMYDSAAWWGAITGI